MAKKMTLIKNKTRQTGVTLIELLVAVTISSVLLIGVGSVYYNSKRTHLVLDEFAQLQEGSRIAVKFMVEDIRKAGFVGCAFNDEFNDPNAQPPKFESFLINAASAEDYEATTNFAIAVSGFEATDSGQGDTVDLASPATGYDVAPAVPAPLPITLPTFITPIPQSGSDIIIIRYASNNGVRMSDNKNAANFRIDDLGNSSLDSNGCHVPSGICIGHILIATDCEKSRMFQTTNIQVNPPNEMLIVHSGPVPGQGILPGNAPTAWGGAASPAGNSFEPDDTYIFRAFSAAYYIAVNPDNNINPNNEPSLYRVEMRFGAIPQELITGVENMQILYGLDTNKSLTDGDPLTNKGDGVANAYIPANMVTVADENVVSVRFSLLLRTTNEVSTKSTASPTVDNYLLAGRDATDGTIINTVPDRRIRKVFTTTVKIRNKGL